MNYKTDCPNCGGNDFYVTPQNGVGYCFHCSYLERSDNTNDRSHKPKADIESIRNFYNLASRYYHSALNKTAVDYLHKRGFTDDMIEELQIGYIPLDMPAHFNSELARDSGLYVSGKSVLGNRISFPYLVGRSVTDIRARSLDPDEETRYKSPLGSAELRGAVFPYNYRYSKVDHVVTEGEIKSVLSSKAGIPAVGLPGITSWRAMTSNTQVKQTIVFDSSKIKHSRETVFRAIDKLASKLYNPYVALLPLLGGEKMDIDEFILLKGEEEYRTIINNALPYHEWAKLQRRTNVY
jgi:hypothetical protein